MPTVVHATRRGWVYSPYTCEHCGHQDQGAVYMTASAGAQTGLLQGLEDTRDLAQGTAHGAMEQAGDEHIALAPCPKCGQRDELARNNFYAKATPWLAGGGVFSSLGVGGAAYLASRGEPIMGVVVMAPILLLGLVALTGGLFKRFKRLPAGVVFRSVDPRPWASTAA